MRLALIACALFAVWAPSASAQALAQSDNVELVTKLPDAVGAISANFSPDGKTMYVSTVKGLHIYDVSDPAAPTQLGVLPLPHFENEDVDVGSNLVIITNDPSEGVGVIYAIDVSDPTLPVLVSATPNGEALGPIEGIFLEGQGLTGVSYTGHIANCLQDCKYVWTTGTEQGIVIWDFSDPANPKALKAVPTPIQKNAAGEPNVLPGLSHDVYIDRAGIAWVTGQDGTFGYTTTDPTNPKLIYHSDEKVINSGQSPTPSETANDYPLDLIHHNSIRTAIQLGDKPPATPTPTPAATAEPTATATAPAATATATPGATTIPTVTVTPGATATATATATAAATPGATATPAPSAAPPATKPATGKKPRKPSVPKYKKRFRRCKTDRCRGRVIVAYKRALKAYKRKLKAYRQRLVHKGRTTRGGLGDVLAITEEDYTRPGCNGQGSFQTWQIKPGQRNADGTIKLDLLDLWTTEYDNSLASGDGRAEATVNCSAHWFDEDQGLLAQGWYDQGVRFLDINNPRDIKQVGYWVTQGTFWGAYFAPTDKTRQIVYALDVTSGIDVLRIDRTQAAKVRAPILKRWMSGVRFDRVGTPSPTFGFACPQLLSTVPG